MSNEARFNGVKFTVNPIFSTGYTINDEDARRLNAAALTQLRGVINPQLVEKYGSVRDLAEDAEMVISEEDHEFYQNKISELVENFAWEISTRGRTADPVLNRMKTIARNQLIKKMQKAGKSVSDFESKQITRMVNATVENNQEMLRNMAVEQLAREEQELDLDFS